VDHPLKIAFAGLRHGHILALFSQIENRKDLVFSGAWEQDQQARQAAVKLGVSCSYTSYEAILKDPAVDVVAIGDYYVRRGQLAIRALQAGKHVLADKPLCTSLEECSLIRKEAEARRLTVGMMLDLRSSQNMVTALEAVRSGRIGKVNNILFEGQHPMLYGSRPEWYFEKEKYGGLFNDIAIHGIDAARLFTGSELQTVIGARDWNFYAEQQPEFPDSGQLTVKMADGAGVMGDISYGVPDAQGYTHPDYWRFRVCGKLGYLTFTYSSDGVTACLDGQDKPCRLADVPVEKNWLDEYVEAVYTGNADYTVDMLASQEAALKIEKAAVHEAGINFGRGRN